MTMSDELTKKSINSFAWKTAQSICSLGITFIIQLILARMLMPEDFGLIAIVNVFMTLANTVIETSFSSSIIQQDNLSQKMLSSVFYLNAILSAVIYVILFLIAPLLSAFYKEPILIAILRVQGIRVVISAVYSIQQALMNRKMRFKALFFCYFIGSIFQAFTGIVMAYHGMGIWSLVLSTCVGSAVTGMAIIVVEFWKPNICFSFDLIKESIDFSAKILITRVVKKIYYNIRVLVIGKVYDAETLGYFNKGFQFPTTAMTVVDGSLTSVAFTHLAKLQKGKDQFVDSLRHYVRYAMFVCTPIMVGMTMIAKPLVLFLLTERWIECVPYLQIICLSEIFIPLSIKITALESLGRSDFSMRLNVLGIAISIVLLFASMPFSPLVMTFSAVVSNLLLQVFTTALTAKQLQYSVLDQIQDALSGLIPTAVMAVIVILLGYLNFREHYLMELVVKVTAGICSFVLACMATKNVIFYSIWDVAKGNLRRNSL